MKLKRIGAWAACLVLTCCLLAIPAAAKTEPGVYTASMVTTYYNPDTNNVDDGGTANAALGEGMCRSATDRTAFVEVDGDGNIWLTVRLLLQSNCSDVAFYTRSGYDSYTQVNYDIIAEDAANDSIDYRFKVSEAGQKLKCTMYVAPMGRDVLWYLYVDTATMTAGSGDFVVSIDTGNLGTEVSAPTDTETAAPAELPETPPAEEPQDAEDVETEPDDAAQEPEEDPDAQETPGEILEPDETQVPEENAPAETDGADTPELTDGGVQPAGTGGLSGGTAAGVIVVAVLLAGAAVYLIKRKQ